MARAKFTIFTVTGRGIFPTDMLRHDACYPNDADSAVTMMEARSIRSVTLRTDWPLGVTPARWESFGWKVSTK